MTPVHLFLFVAAAATDMRVGLSSDASASAPTPCEVRPKNTRRVCRWARNCRSSGCGVMFGQLGNKFSAPATSRASDGFMQIQNDARDIRPRGQLGWVGI